MARASMLHSPRFWLTLGLCLLSSSPALAFEREWHLGAGAGVAFPPGEYAMGPELAVHGAYGVSDVFDIRLELAGAKHAHDVLPDATVLSGAAGLAYKLDIIEWVPYGGVLAGYLWSDQDPLVLDGLAPSVTLGLIVGLDYGFSRHFALGIAYREDFMLRDGSAYGSLFLRGEYRWGW
jgi:hypothetical protein